MRCAIPLTLAAAVLAAGCTTTSSSPATTPDLTSSTPSFTTTDAPARSTTTTAGPSRRDVIVGIFVALEAQRLSAIDSGDREAFVALFADTPYLDKSLAVFEAIEPGEAPVLSFELGEVLRDDKTCLIFTYTATNVGTGNVTTLTTVTLSPGGRPDEYLYQLTTPGLGEWLCDGPHPLASQ
ncbi:MAG: hypothetical protein ACR2N2_05620 [Acidimicrobiia bacterium]